MPFLSYEAAVGLTYIDLAVFVPNFISAIVSLLQARRTYHAFQSYKVGSSKAMKFLLSKLPNVPVMLAFELYLKNRGLQSEAVKRVKPVKKLLGKSARADSTTPSQYGSKKSEEYPEFKPLMHALSMPLNTAPKLGLPQRGTGANSPKPYVELFGSCELGKSRNRVLLSIGRDDGFTAELDLDSRKSKIVAKGRIRLNIDRERYFVKKKNLFELYVKSKILSKNSEYSAQDFRRAAQAIFRIIVKRWPVGEKASFKRPIPFSVVVIPTKEKVEFRTLEEPGASQTEFIDAFGRKATEFAASPTLTAKFLSYDDPAFSLNCKKKREFYKNLGIGKQSHESINIPSESVFSIAGLNWLFTVIDDSSLNFEKTGKGIYYQLWKNYENLKAKGSSFLSKSQTKVACYKTTQAKMELLLDENLTMPQMTKLFSGLREKEEPPFMALEVLIDSGKKGNQWGDYITAIRHLVSQKPMSRDYLVSRLTVFLRNKLFSWIEPKNNLAQEARDFFLRSGFCIKVLTNIMPLGSSMSSSEDYAYHVGRIAQEYIRFKENADEKSNSLRDILSFSRYDREKLRFVVQRVGLGVSLSKAAEPDIKTISEFMKKEIPQTEIPDPEAHNDFSYFFFKGVFGGVKQ